MSERWVKATVPGATGGPDMVIAINMAHVRAMMRIGEVTLIALGDVRVTDCTSVSLQTGDQRQTSQHNELRPHEIPVREGIDHFLPSVRRR
jgi:hypothetical protein